MLVIFQKIAIIFALAAVGLFASKRNILPASSTPHLTKLLLTINLPAFILCSVSEISISNNIFTQIKEISIIMLLFYTVGFAFTLFITKILPFPKEQKNLYSMLLLYPNTGFMGMPIISSIYGNQGLLILIFENIFVMIFLYSQGIFLLNSKQGTKLDLKSSIKSVCNPCMLASMASVFLLLLDIKFPTPILDFLHLVGDMSVPLSMILVGILLGGSSITKLLKKPDLMLFTVLKSTMFPAIMYLCLSLANVTPLVRTVSILCVALPSAVIIAPLSDKYGYDSQLAAGGVALSTLFSIFTIPIICSLV